MPTLQVILRTRLHLRKILLLRRRHISSLFVMLVFVVLAAPWSPLATSQGFAAPVAQQRQSCSGVYHTVRTGQTIYAVAAAYGTTAYRIAVCNRLGSYTLYVGQTVLVPTGTPYRRP